jgi:protein-arginine kinase activator protein McsA
LEPVIASIHGNVRHVEEAFPVPSPPSVQAEMNGAAERDPVLVDLKNRLQQAVAQERFEEAASVRDQIRKIRGV